MAVFKCKMCGGDLNIEAGMTVAECEYCGTKQTVPNMDSEKKAQLFERAGRLLRTCQFDAASGAFAAIAMEYPQEAEAHWGQLLCRYGIEYVDDPASGKKIPTCHRSSFTSFLEEKDFELVMETADPIARKVYREEAKQIEELRKGIIEVSSKEEPYDIFICYKETDEKGNRTIDSVIAQDVYDALTDKGYRVFFSRITLEDKLGQEYEPYIFAALNSAKVMLAFGTDYEYYNTVWVKNEWSRFLQLMTKDKSKHLIPCYKGIDAYDMPKEFAKLQAQDMGKVGAVQDLLRGIEKIVSKEKEPVKEVVVGATINTDSLLKRVFTFLENGEWDKADLFVEQVLSIDSTCAEAYVAKLMLDLHVKKQEALADRKESFSENINYQNAIRYGSKGLSTTLKKYIDHINTRNENDRLAREVRAKKNKKLISIVAPAICVLVSLVIVLTTVVIPKKTIETNRDRIKNCTVGDSIILGTYEQDNNLENGKEDIEWIVLEVKDNKALVITKYVIDSLKYNTAKGYEPVAESKWDNSSLRAMLYGRFVPTAFTDDERNLISTITVSAEKNPDYNTDPGSDTKDQVFLLSISEAEKYFGSDYERQCYPTEYVANKSKSSSDRYHWWLRTPGAYHFNASCVSADGSINIRGKGTDSTSGVRPAMWIDLSAV